MLDEQNRRAHDLRSVEGEARLARKTSPLDGRLCCATSDELSLPYVEHREREIGRARNEFADAAKRAGLRRSLSNVPEDFSAAKIDSTGVDAASVETLIAHPL